MTTNDTPTVPEGHPIMICINPDCGTPMVTRRYADKHGLPEGHRRHLGRGLCAPCYKAEKAAEKRQEAEDVAPPPFDLTKARADLLAWYDARDKRRGMPVGTSAKASKVFGR